MKPNINSAEIHPQLSNKGHPMDGVLVANIHSITLRLKVELGNGRFKA
jgi:hypothetical protein